MEPNLDNNKPNNFSNLPAKKGNKVYIWILAVVLLLTIIFAVFYKQGIWPKKEVINLPPAPQYTKTDLSTDKLSEIFPKDLIQEKDPMILESYQAEIKDKLQTQYSVKYLSKNNLETNWQLYAKYLYGGTNKWITINQTHDAKSFYIHAGKDIDTVYINFNESNLVEVTLVRLNINIKDLKSRDSNLNNEL
ncbi:MAG: hypothetical protein AAB629_02935 [Patescibacteria group bacterium]